MTANKSRKRMRDYTGRICCINGKFAEGGRTEGEGKGKETGEKEMEEFSFY